MDEAYDPTWALRCDGGNSEKRRQTFARLARRAVVALGLKFNHPLEALDAWLNRLHRFHWGLKTRFGRAHWCVSHVAEAAAEYCAELSTRFHEAGNSDSEGKFSDFERQFRELEDPDAEFAAIHRRDTCLKRSDYPFTEWLYDHGHEPLQDPKAELEYWSDHIWGGYQGRIEHWDRLDRTGPAWAALPEKLKDAAAGLSYDLAVLQANHAIDRGLRGDEAMRDFQAEADKLLRRVIDAERSSWRRLGLAFDEGAEGTRMLAEAFARVGDDFRKLLPDLPPATSNQLATQPDPDPGTINGMSPGDWPMGPKTKVQIHLADGARGTVPALAASFCAPESFGENPFGEDDPRHAKWAEFAKVNCERVARLVTGLRELRHVVDDASYATWRSQHAEAPEVYDPERVASWLGLEGASKVRGRFDQIFGEVLQAFLQERGDLRHVVHIIQNLADAMGVTLGGQASADALEAWTEGKLDLVKELADNVGLPPCRWRIDHRDRERVEEKRLTPVIARLMKAAGAEFEHDRQAVDACLDLLCKEGICEDENTVVALGTSLMTLCERLEIDRPDQGGVFVKLHTQLQKLAVEGFGDCTAIRLPAQISNPQKSGGDAPANGEAPVPAAGDCKLENGAASTADFPVSGRAEAIGAYTSNWGCSEAALARTATVDPADLSKWKNGRLPAGSDKAARIERALRENKKPIPSAKLEADI